MLRGLPAPWTVVWSKSKQSYYYYNLETQESSWTIPVPDGNIGEKGGGSNVARPQASISPSAPEDPAALLPPSPPSASPSAPASAPSSPQSPTRTPSAAGASVQLEEGALHDLPSPWVAVWSGSRQKYYYYNKESQVSTWSRPLVQSMALGDSPRDNSRGSNGMLPSAHSSAAEAAKGLPSPWQAVWSQSRSKHYYYNPDTDENTWVRPT